MNTLDTLERTEEGYLKNVDVWTPEIGELLALEAKITLTPAHWEIIELTRSFYLSYETAPAMRALVRLVKQQLGHDKGNSIYLATLFPGGVAKQANKFAGLPKPIRCI